MKNQKTDKKKPDSKNKAALLPTKEALVQFIKESPVPVSKNQIARAFNLHDDQRIALKRLLREIEGEGEAHKMRGRKIAPPQALADSAVLEILHAADDGEYAAKLANPSDGLQKKITLYISHHQAKTLRMEGLGKGDRVLAKLERHENNTYSARPIKRVNKSATRIVGFVEKAGAGFTIRATERKNKEEYELAPKQNIAFEDGDVVVAEVLNGERIGKKQVHVSENLGNFDAPKTVSLIAIAQHGIPWHFPDAVVREADALEAATLGKREDLRKMPLVTIDGADARDFDDAVFAEKDPSADNRGGWHLVVAIADVSHYVKAGSLLDREAYKRGNSVYFPDRVVPMLPEALSNELCSLKPKVDRACLVAHMTINSAGELKKFHFTRALIRSAARLTYEQADAAAKGKPDETTLPLLEKVIHPLYAAYDVLLAARKKRGTLDLDIAERVIKIGADGRVASIGARDRLDSHKLIEEFMILANVAAASALQDAGMAGLYRVHDSPSAEKLDALRGFLKGYGIKLAHGKNLRPADLAFVLEKFVGTDHSPVINEVMLRSQAQAIYSAENIGHFGLALARYAHFTSPIRRYADLVVHRALIRLYKLGEDGLSEDEAARLDEIGEHISATERRAIDAERSASDRYTSLYLAKRIGDTFEGRISGVTRSGLFVRLTDSGADGFIAMQTLPHDYYVHEEAEQKLRGVRHGLEFRLAQLVNVKLVEADPVVGGLRFTIGGYEDRPSKADAEAKHPRHNRPQTRSHRRGNKRRS